MQPRKLNILYGSQTGTAQEAAERLWRDSKRFYYQGAILAMDEYPVTQLIFESCVIFVCSTTGDGKEPDNMKKFWRFLLRNNLPLHSLKGLRFGVLGLGDSSYVKFNFVAKKLYRRLLQLGGHAILEIGLADDQHDLGPDAVIDKWSQQLWEKLNEIFPLPLGIVPLDENVLFPARWDVKKLDMQIKPEYESNLVLYENCEYQGKYPSIISMESNIRTTSENHFQDVRLLEFHNSGIVFEPGDVLLVQPQNSEENVKKFFEVVSETPNSRFNPSWFINVLEKSPDVPLSPILKQPLTLMDCVKQYWDLNTVPHRYFFKLLLHFTSSELEKDKLKEFVTAEGQQDLFNYCNRPKRSVIETLADFPHAASNIPLEYLFELFRPIKPRAFSIASSPKYHEGEIHLLVAIVEYKTTLHLSRHGLCSTWLASLAKPHSIPVWVEKGAFVFPSSLNTPVIMIGPGTGVAPFRSFIYEKVALKQARADLLYLFFGCRNKEGDFHLKNEWEYLQKNRLLTMFCAFSRDQEDKEYVQNIMKKQAALLWDLFCTQSASVYIAGRSDGMPAAVNDVLINDVAVGCGNMTLDEANEWFTNLGASGRYQMETWS